MAIQHIHQNLVRTILDYVNGFTDTKFNSVLVNYYENGKQGLPFDSDDEPSIIPRSKIASLSIGIERIFDLLNKEDNSLTSIPLPSSHY